VTLNPTSLTLPPGQSTPLTAQVLPANASNQNVTWQTSNQNYVTVNNGTITATSNSNYIGYTATITVRTADGNFSATCQVTVGNPVSGVSIDPSTVTLPQGTSQTLSVIFSPQTATNKNVSWSSSNSGIVSVSSSGLITAVSGGTAVITVTTADGGHTAQCTVTVPFAVIRLDEFTSGWFNSVDGNRFKLVFNKPIQSATAGSSLTNAAVAISGSEVTISRSNGNFNTGTHNVTVQSTDGDVLTVTVELTQSWWSYDWSLR
jgi:uncharacterized protein YjdB